MRSLGSGTKDGGGSNQKTALWVYALSSGDVQIDQEDSMSSLFAGVGVGYVRAGASLCG